MADSTLSTLLREVLAAIAARETFRSSLGRMDYEAQALTITVEDESLVEIAGVTCARATGTWVLERSGYVDDDDYRTEERVPFEALLIPGTTGTDPAVLSGRGLMRWNGRIRGHELTWSNAPGFQEQPSIFTRTPMALPADARAGHPFLALEVRLAAGR